MKQENSASLVMLHGGLHQCGNPTALPGPANCRQIGRFHGVPVLRIREEH